MLQYGQQNDQVKELQQMLRDAGYFTFPSNTGYFGDITLNALKKYQQDKGLNVTGAYDDTTAKYLPREKQAQQVLQQYKGTPYEEVVTNAYKTNDPAFYKGVDALTNPNNVYMGNGTVLSPEDINNARMAAEKELTPYYQQGEQYNTGLYNNSVGDIMNTYGSNVSNLQSGLQTDLNTLNENEGVGGTWASSARNERLNSLQNKYNQKFQDIYDTANSGLNRYGMNQEYNYGTNTVNQSPLIKYSTSLSGNTPNYDTTSSVYNPFGNMSGRINAQKQAGITSLANSKIQGQYYNPFNYLN